MASESKAKRLRNLATEIPSDFITEATLKVLYDQDTILADSAIVLLAGTMIDSALETALLAKFRPLSSGERAALFSYDKKGPMCDFSAKIKVAYAIGIYGPKTKDDLDSVRILRNHFAHPNKHYSFETPLIAEIVDGLHVTKTITILGAQYPQNHPKGRFLAASAALASRIKSDIENLAGKDASYLAKLMAHSALLP